MRSVRPQGLVLCLVFFALACATSAPNLGEPLSLEVGDEVFDRLNAGGRMVRFYLQPGAAESPTVRACATYAPTGSRRPHDTCRSPDSANSSAFQAAYQLAQVYEQAASAALERNLATGPIPIGADGRPVLEATPEIEAARRRTRAGAETTLNGSTTNAPELGPERVEGPTN